MRLLSFGQAAAMGLCLISSLLGKDAFSIPAYPGTQASHHNQESYQNLVALPLITTFAVFKTQDGSPLPAKDVLEYYRDFYEKRGWTRTASQASQSDPYLEFTFGLTGRLSLWVAPKDGVIVAHLYQWRDSKLEESGTRFLNQTLESLRKTGKGMGYSMTDLPPQAHWPRYYEDENLVKVVDLVLSLPSKDPRGCTDGSGMIFGTVLAYKDAAAAAEHAAPVDPGNGSVIVLSLRGTRSVVVRENLVITLDPGDRKQDNAVKKLVQNLPAAS